MSGFGCQFSGFRFRVSSFGCQVPCPVFRVSGVWCPVLSDSCFMFRMSGFGFRVSGFGFRVSGFGLQFPDVWFRGGYSGAEDLAGDACDVLSGEVSLICRNGGSAVD